MGVGAAFGLAGLSLRKKYPPIKVGNVSVVKRVPGVDSTHYS